MNMVNMYSSHYVLKAMQVDCVTAKLAKIKRKKPEAKRPVIRICTSKAKIRDQLARSMVEASGYAEQTGLPRAVELARVARARFLAFTP